MRSSWRSHPVGVQFVRSTDAFDGDPGAFAQAYRQRFARPLRPADRAPAGLLPVLSGRRGPTPPLDLRGLSEFERNVLAATRTIPTGETRPYGWVASEAGNPHAVRAAASVLARNPVPLLVPCHRVVRADGALGRYLFGAEHKENAAARREHEPRRRSRPRPPRRALPGQRHHRDRVLPDLPPRAAHHPGAPGRVRHRRRRRRRRVPAVPLLPSRGSHDVRPRPPRASGARARRRAPARLARRSPRNAPWSGTAAGGPSKVRGSAPPRCRTGHA